jgi:hypothetical protein
MKLADFSLEHLFQFNQNLVFVDTSFLYNRTLPNYWPCEKQQTSIGKKYFYCHNPNRLLSVQ